MEVVEVFVEGGIAIAGVGLLALTLGVLFPYCRKETDKGIQKTNKMILSLVKELTNSHSSKHRPRDSLLENICKLRRRKAHLQKDNQNFFFLFLFTSVSFILIGIIPLSGFGNYLITIKASLASLSILSFIIGALFIRRLFIELQRIDKESLES